jgi:hypothetical protein
MTSSTLSGVLHDSESCQDEYVSSEQVSGLSGFSDEADASQGSVVRGVLTGILLGAGMWTGLFFLIAALRH